MMNKKEVAFIKSKLADYQKWACEEDLMAETAEARGDEEQAKYHREEKYYFWQKYDNVLHLYQQLQMLSGVPIEDVYKGR